jgi:hypothetical protein
MPNELSSIRLVACNAAAFTCLPSCGNAPFTQGVQCHAQAMISVIHRTELAHVQQFGQLVCVDAVALAAIFQQGILSRITHYEFRAASAGRTTSQPKFLLQT